MKPLERLMLCLERGEDWLRLLDRMHNAGEITTEDYMEFEIWLSDRQRRKTIIRKRATGLKK